MPKVLRYGPDDPANMEDGTAEQMLFLGIDEQVPREIYRHARRFVAVEAGRAMRHGFIVVVEHGGKSRRSADG